MPEVRTRISKKEENSFLARGLSVSVLEYSGIKLMFFSRVVSGIVAKALGFRLLFVTLVYA